MDSMDKIALKGGPKQYKSGPGPEGAFRLQCRANALMMAAHRLEQKQGEDAAYAGALRDVLREFLRANWQNRVK